MNPLRKKISLLLDKPLGLRDLVPLSMCGTNVTPLFNSRNLEIIYSHAGIGIIMMSAKGCFIQANPKFCEMTGYLADELIGRHYNDITHPEDLNVSDQFYQQLLGCQSGPVVGEKRYLHKKGHSLWVKISMTPVRQETGEILYFVTTIEDITQQKKSAGLLKHQKEVLELMAKNFPLHQILSQIARLIEEQDPGSLASLCLIQSGKMALRAAPSFPKGFESDTDEYDVGLKSGSCGAAAYYKKQIISKDILTDPSWPEKLRNQLSSMGIRSVCSTPVLSQDGEVLGTINLCWKTEMKPSQCPFELLDVVHQLMGIAIERDRTEKLLKEHQMKMVSSSKLAALGEMAGGLSHEINNPLAIINIKVSELQRATAGNNVTPELATHIASRIQETTGRIHKIVKGLLTFARDDNHELVREVSMESILEDTMAFCRERFRGHGIELRLELDADAKLHCRPTQISQVILSLLNNSHDALENVPDKWIQLKVQNKEQFIFISVTDSGAGIPKQFRDRIFQPFFTTKGVSKGTGLGLSISSSIVASHQGTLQLDPDSNHTRFVIALPKNLKVFADSGPDAETM